MSEAAKLLASVRARFPMRSVAVGPEAWGVQDTGQPAGGAAAGTEPLVLLHGAMGSGDTMFRVVDALAPERRVVALTFPALPGAEALARSMATLLDMLGLRRVDLLGTSLGGYVAQAFALDHPKSIRRLLLANTFYDAGLQQQRWPPAEEFDRQSPAEVLAAARKQLQAGAEDTPPKADLKRLMLEQVGPVQSGENVKAMRLCVLTAAVLPPVPLSADAVVLIDDSADPVIAQPTREQMRTRYAASRHFDIAGGGHFPANLQPAAYVAAIRQALDGTA
jgi:maspardin